MVLSPSSEARRAERGPSVAQKGLVCLIVLAVLLLVSTHRLLLLQEMLCQDTHTAAIPLSRPQDRTSRNGMAVKDQPTRTNKEKKKKENSNKPLKNHPHMGARDEHGQWGYVHDPTYLRRHPLDFTYHPPEGNGVSICDAPFGKGEEGHRGIWALKKIVTAQNGPRSRRVLCIVYTHSNRHDALQAIAETYGPRCHGFLAGSNLTNRTIGAVDIPHSGEETYGNMWQKVRSIWAYVHDHYLDEYDFFHIGGDDAFVVPENLILAATTINISFSEPIYMGHAQGDIRRRRRFCGGGAGYTINRLALAILVRDKFHTPDCWPNHTGSDEDRIIGNCLRWDVVNCTHNTDAWEHSRYHPLDAQFHAMFTTQIRGNSLWDGEGLSIFHGIYAPTRELLDSVSPTSISFHFARHNDPVMQSPRSLFHDRGIRRYHAIIHDLCPNQNKSTIVPMCRKKREFLTDDPEDPCRFTPEFIKSFPIGSLNPNSNKKNNRRGH